jgi:alkanesulfonate monooxygenase SsuD/methylene tetrahydromethanopterin reductase-like flavin-dependent oxidoreductase (luciferase family)
MRFGLVLPIQSTTVDLSTLWDELVAETVAAEQAGFELVGLPEFHQARAPVLMSPIILGAQLLAATARIRFAPLVLCGPLHHPVRLAEEYAVLDWTSGGRAVLGIGVGHQPADLAAYGVVRDTRALRTEELLDVFARCFGGEPFVHRGRFFDVDLAVPLQTASGGRPEVWIGAHSRAGLARAARFGDLWLSDPQRDVDTIGILAGRYAEACGDRGVTPRVGLFREAFIGESRTDCARRWGPHALAVHRLYYNVGVYRRVFEPWIDEVAERGAFTFDRLAPGRFLYGSGTDIRADVEDWARRTGAEWIVVRMRHPGGPSHDETLEAIRRFGDEVISKCA